MGLTFKSFKIDDRYFARWPRPQGWRGSVQRALWITASIAILLGVVAVFSFVVVTVASIVLVLGALAWANAALRGALGRCPRCQRRLTSRGSFWRPMNYCQHCDLPEHALDEPANQRWETIDVSSTPVSR